MPGKEQSAEQAILSRAIIQIVGKPEGHVVKAMDLLLKKLKEDKHFAIKATEISDPEPQDTLFSIFVEVEFKTKTIDELSGFCFDYLPASIEIIEPRELIYTAEHLTRFFNEIQSRIHTLDLALKTLSVDNKQIKQKGSIIIRNMIHSLIRTDPKTLTELAELTGIAEHDLQTILEELLQQQRVSKSNEKYRWVKPL